MQFFKVLERKIIENKKQTESQITLDCHQDFFSYTKRRDAKFLEVFVRQSHKSRQINLKKWNHVRTITQNRTHKKQSAERSVWWYSVLNREIVAFMWSKPNEWTCYAGGHCKKWLKTLEISLHSQLPLVLGRRWSTLRGQFFLTVLGDLEKTSNIYLKSFLSFLS